MLGRALFVAHFMILRLRLAREKRKSYARAIVKRGLEELEPASDKRRRLAWLIGPVRGLLFGDPGRIAKGRTFPKQIK